MFNSFIQWLQSEAQETAVVITVTVPTATAMLFLQKCRLESETEGLASANVQASGNSLVSIIVLARMVSLLGTYKSIFFG